MDRKISEYRVYCKIRASLGFRPDFQKVYGNGALKDASLQVGP
jgi:hypothetical protein